MAIKYVILDERRLLDYGTDYLIIERELKRSLLKRWKERFPETNPGNEKPVYILPSNDYDHLSYFLLGSYFPGIDLLTYDYHSDTNVSRLKKGMKIQSPLNHKTMLKVLNRKDTEKITKIMYKKTEHNLMGPSTYIEDLFEDGLTNNVFWIRSYFDDCILYQMNVEKNNNTFTFTRREIQRGDIRDLTKIVLSERNKLYLGHDPDIHPQNVVNTPMGRFCGNVPLDKMMDSLKIVLFSKKMVGMTVSTQNERIINSIKSTFSNYQ